MEIGKWVSCLHSGKVELPQAAIAKRPLVSLSTFWSLVTKQNLSKSREWAGFSDVSQWNSILLQYQLCLHGISLYAHQPYLYLYLYLNIYILYIYISIYFYVFISFQDRLYFNWLFLHPFLPPLHHQIPMARHLFTSHRIIPNRAHAANTSTGPVDPIITSPFLRMLENSHWGDQYFTTHQDSGLNNTTHY